MGVIAMDKKEDGFQFRVLSSAGFFLARSDVFETEEIARREANILIESMRDGTTILPVGWARK